MSGLSLGMHEASSFMGESVVPDLGEGGGGRVRDQIEVRSLEESVKGKSEGTRRSLHLDFLGTVLSYLTL